MALLNINIYYKLENNGSYYLTVYSFVERKTKKKTRTFVTIIKFGWTELITDFEYFGKENKRTIFLNRSREKRENRMP